MPSTNYYQQDLPGSYIAPVDRAKLLADQMVMTNASSTDTPIISPAVGWTKVLAGLLGGYLHGQDLRDIQAHQSDAISNAYGPYPGSQPTAGDSGIAVQGQDPAAAASTSPAAAAAAVRGWADPHNPTPPDQQPASDATYAPQAPAPAPPVPMAGSAALGPQASLGPPAAGAAGPAASYPSLGFGPGGQRVTAGAVGADGSYTPNAAAPQSAISPGPQPGGTQDMTGSGAVGGPAAQAAYAAASQSASPALPAAPTLPAPAPAPAIAPAPQPRTQPQQAGPMQMSAPMDPATYDSYRRVLMNPYTDPAFKQQVMTMIMPQRITRPDGSIVQYNPVTGTGQQIMAPAPDIKTIGDTGLTYDAHTGKYFSPAGPISQGQSGSAQGQGYDPWHVLSVAEKTPLGYPPNAVVMKNIYTGEYKSPPPSTTVNVGGAGGSGKAVDDALMTPLMTFVGGKNGDKTVNAIENNSKSLAELQALQSYVNSIQAKGGSTGAGSQEFARVESAVNFLGTQFGISPKLNPSDPEAIGKFTRQLAAEMASDSSNGNRMTNMALSNALASTPSNDLSLPGNQRVLGLMMQQRTRSIEIGKAIRSTYAQEWAESRRTGATAEFSPQTMYKIIDDYDNAHHPTDPLTGEDLTKVQNNPGGQQAAPAASPQAPAAAPQGPAAAPPVIQSQKDYQALPKGTLYTAPDGTVRTKQ